ncbi:MAG: NADH-quinone oxidoreductase subunit NuoH [Candidatus Alcyoniella australis]|nr:NADH-quinone oxidoreductase subunit NuoH [Candidatus Alcyoniella australis]
MTASGVEQFSWLIFAFKMLLIFAGFLTVTAYNTLYERRVAAALQQRVGPNRVGPLGLLQPIADGVKLIFKEDLTPAMVDRFLYFLAPSITMSCTLAIIAVIPFTENAVIADFNVGLLYLLAVSSLAVYGIVLAGWSSNSKYSLLGGLRSSAQMISYELAIGLSVALVVMLSGSFNLSQVIAEQQVHWNLWKYPPLGLIGFFVFYIAMLAETNRAPFDFPEAEQELVAGFHTEYSAMKFAGFYIGEYGNMVAAASITAVLFLGGYQLPLGLQAKVAAIDAYWVRMLIGLAVMLTKVAVLIFTYFWVRWTLPRYRYDQLMELGWKRFVPIGLANLMLTAIYMLAWQRLGWGA